MHLRVGTAVPTEFAVARATHSHNEPDRVSSDLLKAAVHASGYLNP